MEGRTEIASALRQIARGFDALAAAITSDDTTTQQQRELAVLREWSEHGLDRAQTSALFRKHGFAPQAAGGWARGDWIETRDDGRRHLTQRSRRLLAEQEATDNDRA